MGKTRDLFEKIRDTKGTFHATMDTIKDRNSILNISYQLNDLQIFSPILCVNFYATLLGF